MRIEATDLEQWAARHESWFAFPELVRRLIHQTARTRWADMPAGDGVGAPGWDGLFDAGEGNAWVPQGWSTWELGSGKKPTPKAEADYAKRVRDSLGRDPKETTFVFVTLRRGDRRRGVDPVSPCVVEPVALRP